LKNLTVLGATGSIGTNVLNIVEMFPDRFAVKALTAKHNISKLAEQIQQFRPDMAVVFDEAGADELAQRLPRDMALKILHGPSGYCEAAAHPASDTVVTAVVGAAGLVPTLAAIESGKNIALANKETLVMAGEMVMRLAADSGVSILPVDSEHSAIFQCLMGQRREDLDRILITASGGPFLARAEHTFPAITPQEALRHPNWQMGNKITIDSATLMNKGLEVIEAKHLFQVEMENIQVVIHPQSIIHSMVAYRDGSIIAQLGIPDMKGAIAFALSYPERLPLRQPLPDLNAIGKFTFQQPDLKKFACLGLAIQACQTGATLPAVMNAANEIAVEAFLTHKISFPEIPEIIQQTMSAHTVIASPSLENILNADQWSRSTAARIIQRTAKTAD
jgi:1-deoxy-D-xylulose-5-phosphate reductoisomerase